MDFSICNGKERLKKNGKKVHSTQKPEALLHRIILATTNKGDSIFDPFLGTGTTAVVAKKLGRNYFGIEKERKYFKAASDRIEKTKTIDNSYLDNPFQSLKKQPIFYQDRQNYPLLEVDYSLELIRHVYTSLTFYTALNQYLHF